MTLATLRPIAVTTLLMLSLCFWHNDTFAQNLPEIDLRDSSVNVFNGKFADDMPTVFAYSKPDTTSQRIICIGSGFSEEEAKSCLLGGHYELIEPIERVTFIEQQGSFVKLLLVMYDASTHDIYMRTSDIKFVGKPKKSAKKSQKK